MVGSRFGWMVLLLASGCATTLTGMPTATPAGVVLADISGREHRLVLGPGAEPVAALDGCLVRIEGTRGGKGVRVASWEVVEGLHGMTVWTGMVVLGPSGAAIRDRGGVLYTLDDATSDALSDNLGDPVLIEGYVDGTHHIRAMYTRVLAADER